MLVIESLSALCAPTHAPTSAKDTPASNTTTTNMPTNCLSPLYRLWHLTVLGWLRLQSVAGHRHALYTAYLSHIHMLIYLNVCICSIDLVVADRHAGTLSQLRRPLPPPPPATV